MDFDVIVIGSGQAGVALAARLARDGRSVLLAKRAVSAHLRQHRLRPHEDAGREHPCGHVNLPAV